MKNRILVTIAICWLSVPAIAQSPQGFNFQAVVRADNGDPIASQQVTLQLSLSTSVGATPLYRERHTLNTDALGQISLVIGTGVKILGEFNNVPWTNGLIYFDGSITLADGKIISLGSHQFNSVPFSMYSNVAGSLSGTNDISNDNELIESINITDNVLHITEAGNDYTVDLTTLKNDADANPANEIQNLSLAGTTLSLSNSPSTVNLGLINTDSQSLSFAGSTLSISGGNSVDLSSLEDDADANPANEIQGLTVTGSVLNITGANTPVNLGPYLGANTDEQTLSISGTTLSILNGNNVNLSSIVNLQQAYAGGNTLQLNDGNNFRINTQTPAPLFTASSSNARIGIGTSAPTATLDVSAQSPEGITEFRIRNSDATHMLTIFPGRTGDANPFIAASPGDPLKFAHYDGTTLTERFRISPIGNLGLGTNNPFHKAHIVATTTPTTAPELPGMEAGVVIETVETNPASLLSVGLASIMRSNSTGPANYAILGTSDLPAVYNRGVHGFATGGSVDNIGVYGLASGAGNENIGVRGFGGGATTNYGVIGHNTSAGTTNHGGFFHGQYGTATNYGIYATTSGAGTNNYGIYATAAGGTNNYAGHFQGAVVVNGTSTLNGNTSIGGTASITGTTTFQGTVNFPSNVSVQNGVIRKNGQQLIDVKNAAIYIGTNAGNGSTIASFRNIGIGEAALQAQTTGSDNVAIGWNSLDDPTNATWNTSVGSFSMNAVSGAVLGNTSIGADALQIINAGTFNTSIGFSSMKDYVSGTHNVAIGHFALNGPGGGSYNTAIGALALSEVSTGNGNIAIGENAGNAVTTGSNNIAIGSNSDIASGVTNAIAIGANTVADQNDEIILGDPTNFNARIGVGTSSPAAKLHVAGQMIIDGALTVTTITETSDRRLKTDIAPIKNALAIVANIEGVAYHWASGKDTSNHYGVIAQDIEKILPDVVKTDAAGFKSVNYTALIPFLLEALKTQQKQIEQLKTENSSLSTLLTHEIAKLTKRIETIAPTLETTGNKQSEK